VRRRRRRRRRRAHAYSWRKASSPIIMYWVDGGRWGVHNLLWKCSPNRLILVLL